MPWKIEVPYDRNSPYECETSGEAAQIIVDSDEYRSNYELDYSSFDDYIDECYGEIDICGINYYASKVLKDVDEYRYNEWYSEECSERASESQGDVEYELDRNETAGSTCWFYGNINATYYEEDEEDDDEGHDQDEVFDCFIGGN